jgi:hypothetical protein
MTPRTCRLLILSFTAVLSLGASNTATLAAAVRTVALSGQSAPGTPGGVNYGSFAGPVLNAAGQTAFWAELTGDSVDATNNRGIWSEGTGTLDMVARAGSQAPGTPSGVKYGPAFAFSDLSASGQLAIYADLTGPGVDATNNQAIWLSGSSDLELVARTGTQAPGTPSGVNFSGFTFRGLSDTGQTAFRAELSGSGVTDTNRWGIWSGDAAALDLVARRGSQAPGTPSGVNFADSFFDFAAFNSAGQVAFTARLTGSGVVLTTSAGIWSEGSGVLDLVTRSGDHAPGTPSGVNFSEAFFAPTLNAAGQTAFKAILRGNGVNESNHIGIWSEGSGTLDLVARGGSHAPGTPSGVTFNGNFPSLVLNDTGQTAFHAGLTGSGIHAANNSGIWSQASGSLELLAREGTQAPGLPPGVDYVSFGDPGLKLNTAGQVAFRAKLTGSGVDTTNDFGIWASGFDGTLQLIVREGALLEVVPGESRTVSVLRVPSSFNDVGQLGFHATFTDGTSGVFVSNLVASVPEPASGLLCIGAMLAALLSRTRGSKPPVPEIRVRNQDSINL